MTLGELRAATVPRPEMLAHVMAKNIEPMSGFLIYGLVWFFVVTNTLMLGTIFGPEALSGRIPDVLVTALTIVLTIAGQIAGWGVYLRWCRTKRAKARALISDGELIDGVVAKGGAATIATVTTAMAGIHAGTWAKVELPDGRWMLCPFAGKAEPGTTAPVLCKPGYKYALAFIGETPIVAGVHFAED